MAIVDKLRQTKTNKYRLDTIRMVFILYGIYCKTKRVAVVLIER